VGQIIYLRRPDWVWVALAAVALSALGLMIGGAVVQVGPPGFSRISQVIQSRWSTGYFDSAVMLVHKGTPIRKLLGHYPQMLDHFYLHPRQKPPGSLLFEIAMVRIFGDGNAGALASGWVIALVASFSVISTYFFIACFTENRDAAFLGASFFALCPSLLLFYPDFDPCFPNLTALVTILWARALRTNGVGNAVAFGLAYAVAGFITYLPGVLPIFLVGFTWLQHRREANCGWRRIGRQLAISAGVFAAFYGLLWAVTGFDPIATLVECARQVSVLWDRLINVYHYPRHSLPWTFFTDLYDFAMGSGWISFALVGFLLISMRKGPLNYRNGITLAAVSQFVVIAAIGLLQTESARIWIFMYPMLMLPVGMELSGWKTRGRIAVFVALLLLMIAMCQSMEFIGSA
jgi:hypothetical protein